MINISCKAVVWKDEKEQLRSIRTKVFIEEQQVPVELEWDDADQDAHHFLVHLDNEPVACGRLLPSGQIGRMAVLKPFRKKGVGSKLLLNIIKAAEQQNIGPLFLHAQNHAIPFYEKLGFQVQGDEFMDAGIPHHEMIIPQR